VISAQSHGIQESMSVTIFTPTAAKGGQCEAVGRRIDDFTARLVETLNVRVADMIIECGDERDIITSLFRLVFDRRVSREESAVMGIARQRAEDHSHVAGAARTTTHKTQRLTKAHGQICNLPVIAAKHGLFSLFYTFANSITTD